jgi:hypothetical protein
MTVTNGRNLAGFAALINDSGKVIAEAFSTDLAAATRPTVYDSDGDVPFDAPKGSQAYVASEGLLLKLTDAAWYVLDGSGPELPPADLPGTDRGYISGGHNTSNIYKFPFAASTSVSLVGTIVPNGTRHSPAGASSKQNGYSAGGYQYQPGNSLTAEIRQFSFATDGNAVSRIGALTTTQNKQAGANSATHGYAAAGYDAVGLSSLIQKYSFTIDGVSTNVGNLLSVRDMACGISSLDYGFVASGAGAPNQYGNESQIDKFSFVSDGNSTYYGWNFVGKKGAAGLFSTTDGYIAAGQTHPPTGIGHRSDVQKFPFATESNTTTIGDLTYVLLQPAGSSSMEYGYVSGGQGPTGVSSRMSRFVWASTVTDETIGNLAVGGWGQSGYQV